MFKPDLSLPLAKPLLAAVLVASLSIAGNLGLAWKLGQVDGACESTRAGEIETAKAEGRALALEQMLSRTQQLAESLVEDRSALLADLGEIADRGQQVRTVYRTRLEQVPAATCAPGAERQAAVNEAIQGGER